jgi:phosphoglycerate dehydrogenase-like enzyme
MAGLKVLVFAPADETGESHAKLEDAGCELVLGEASWHNPQGDNEDQMRRMAEGAVALTGTSIRSSPISRAIIETSPDLRIVAKYTIGVDDVDVAAATENGVLVTHSPTESNWGGVAEGTMAMMLAALKKTRERDRAMKDGVWRDPALQGTYLGQRQDGWPGITVGIIGMGRIGSRLADLLAPWRVRLIGHDPYVDLATFVHHNVERVDLDTLLAASDVVTLHVTLTPETRHMMGQAQFARMKPTALFINTARGWCVSGDDLFDALDKDVIAGAAIDVFEDEPLDAQSPILGLGDKVLLSPHMISSNHGSGLGPGIEWATRSVLTALAGEVPDNVFNTEAVAKWRARFGGSNILVSR